MRSRHPYLGLPDRQFWKKEPGINDPAQFDPVSDAPFRLTRGAKLVTAGSCFAQHVGRHLAGQGYHHFITEPAHPMFPPQIAAEFNYGMFSARYGNVYTARQLLQLLQRAYGVFVPRAVSWPKGQGDRVVDPFRPQIQPEGFVSETELGVDRTQHFAAIRAAVEGMEVFIFTLGLTEAWEDTRDGAVFPLAPGVVGGVWEPGVTRPLNFDETKTAADLIAALTFIRERNPGVKIMLTVSPVPLNATFEDRHVFVSTTWSKAVLRIAAEKAVRALPEVVYFPSYEIITAPHVRGRYFAKDCREVLPAGVDHVMGVFLRHFGEEGGAAPALPESGTEEIEQRQAAAEAVLDILCDEQAISNE